MMVSIIDEYVSEVRRIYWVDDNKEVVGNAFFAILRLERMWLIPVHRHEGGFRENVQQYQGQILESLKNWS